MRPIFLCLLTLLVLSFHAAPAQKAFAINDLPLNWTQLSEIDKQLVVFNPCDAGNGSIMIETVKGVRKITVGYGHEALVFKVNKIKAIHNGTTNETTFMFFGNYEAMEPARTDTIEAQYNPATKRGKWIMHFEDDAYNTRLYTADENLSAYKQVNQPCRECWPPEECEAMENLAAPVDKNGFEGSYVDNYDKSGYWQRMVIGHLGDDTYKVEITYGGSPKGCTFSGTGKLKKGRIEIDLSKINKELQGTMIIENKGDIMDVSTTRFDQRFDLMYFCGGGASLGIEYYREK